MIAAAIALFLGLGVMIAALVFADAAVGWIERRSPMSRARRGLDALERAVFGAQDQ